MRPLRSDPALYLMIRDARLRGLWGGYVDDLIRGGDEYFRKVAAQSRRRFEMSENQELPCSFAGFTLARNRAGELILDQHSYLKKPEKLSPDATFSAFRSMRMKLA